ncbi:MAG: nicotinate-nucleotide adenylyltransferase [Betaproteobacteria bacterium]|nr:MAG: nicotinate-nucleotide adenylyltransferase [Betaproteobacteria bacterium]
MNTFDPASESPAAPLALFGGTFDPVHFGHLRVATDTAIALKLPEIRLIPSKKPVHRDATSASADQRLAMLRLGVSAFPGLSVDDCELTRDAPSYTALTLEHFRREFPERPLLWIVGIDAFLGITRWYQWQHLFDLAHFVVLNRPGFAVASALSAQLAEVWNGRLTNDPHALRSSAHGRLLLHTVAPQAISATEIRNMLTAGASDNALLPLLPASVLAYIRGNRLYARPN